MGVWGDSWDGLGHFQRWLSGVFKGEDDMPVGSVVFFGGASAPDKWLLCRGQEISRDTYSDLFNVIGTTHGAGDGSTTFNLPDLRGRTPVGAGWGDGLTDRELGDEVGSETHQLTVAQMPTHNHSTTLLGTGSEGTNTRRFRMGVTDFGVEVGTSSSGNNQPHNNMQPSLVLNGIIRHSP